MKVVNLFGGPGAGKSTSAAGAFSKLKLLRKNVELVTEYAKDLTWEERASALKTQAYVFGKQLHRLERLTGKVDLVISDSPLILSAIYAPKSYPSSFHTFVLDMFWGYSNFNVFVERSDKYSPVGRNQTREEAAAIDNEVKTFLAWHGIPYITAPCAEEAVNIIVNEYSK